MMPDHPITPELVTAYWLCQRKAFLLLQGHTGDSPHEYVKLIDAHASRSLNNFLDTFRGNGFDIRQSEDQGMIGSADIIAQATLKAGDLEAKVDALVRMQHGSSEERGHYEPHLVVGTHTARESRSYD